MRMTILRIPFRVALATALIANLASADCPKHLPTDSKSIRVPAVTAHGCPELVGTIVHDELVPFKLMPERGDRSPLWGTVLCRVVRSKKTQALHFYYQVYPSGGYIYSIPPKAEIINEIRIYGWGGSPREAWMGYRTDGTGSITVDSANWYGHEGPPKLDNIQIQLPNRSYGNKNKELVVGSGDKTYQIVIVTKAKGYSLDGKIWLGTFAAGYSCEINRIPVPR